MMHVSKMDGCLLLWRCADRANQINLMKMTARFASTQVKHEVILHVGHV